MIIYSPTFTGSVQITGSQTVTGDLTVQGNLTAQTFILSSSVSYFTESFASGSTRFGDSADDNMIMTGSFKVSGSTGGGFIITGSTGFVGIGTSSPSTLLQTNQTGASGYFYSGQQSGTEIAYWYYNATEVQFSSKSGSRALTFLTTDTERMRITSTGNVGIGTTAPAAWGTPTVGKVIQIGNVASLFSYNNSTTDLASNIYFNGADYLYLQTAGASLYRQQGGVHSWFTVGSGTAGNSAGITERMQITSTGLVGIGTTSPQTLFHLNAASGSNATIYFGVNNVMNGYLGQSAAVNSLSSAAIVGDVVLRSQTNLLFTAGGDYERMRILRDFTLAGSGAGTGGPTQVIGTTSMIGILFVSIGTQGVAAIFIINAGAAPVLVSQSTVESRFSITNDNGNTANVYVSGTDIVLRNNIQATRAFYCQFFGKL